MKARLLPAGDTALLVEVGGVDEVLALTDALRRIAPPAIVDLVPAARTVLVQAASGADLKALARRVTAMVEGLDAVTVADSLDIDHREIEIPVRYDGPDLDEVAELTGMSRRDVIAAHTQSPWRAAFIGFSPGFAYLAGGDSALAVPRRTESRASVPAGSVGLAGAFSAIYPRASPGGWQLIGTTEATLWDLERDPPALLQTGAWVRFVDVDRSPDPATGTLVAASTMSAAGDRR